MEPTDYFDGIKYVKDNLTLIAFLAVIMLAFVGVILRKRKITAAHYRTIRLSLGLFALIIIVFLVVDLIAKLPTGTPSPGPIPPQPVTQEPATDTPTPSPTPSPTMTPTSCPAYPFGPGERLVYSEQILTPGNIEDLQEIAHWPYPDSRSARFIEYSRDSKYLMLGLEDGSIRVLRAASGVTIDEDPRHEDSQLTDLDALTVGAGNLNRFATSSLDTVAYVWDFNGSIISMSHTLEVDNEHAVYSVAFSPLVSDLVATGDGYNRVHLWALPAADANDHRDDETWLDPELLETGLFYILDISFSKDGDRLAVSSSDGSIQLFQVHRSEDLSTAWLAHAGSLPIEGPGDKVFRLIEFSPVQNDVLYAASNYGFLSIYDITLGELIATGDTESPLDDLSLSADGTIVVGIGKSGETSFMYIWDGSGDSLLVNRYLPTVYGISIAPNGKQLAVSTRQGIHVFGIGLCSD